MPGVNSIQKLLKLTLVALPLSACFQPPYNNFEPDKPAVRSGLVGAGVGATVGAFAGNTLAGLAIGTAVGTASGIYKTQPGSLIQALNAQDIQYVQYGDTRTLVVPTDKYYKINSAQLNEFCYAGLNNIVNLLKYYPACDIYVAAFTDDVGSKTHKRKLSQARAEAMLTFLWAHDIPAKKLSAEGYADNHAISDNELIHGSAQNRRIEIQWACAPKPVRIPDKFSGKTK